MAQLPGSSSFGGPRENGTGASSAREVPEACRGAGLAERLLKGVSRRGNIDLTVDSTDAGVAVALCWGVAAVIVARQPG